MPTSEELVYAANPSFGGPASVTVASDKGIFGVRGTNFFLSTGDPGTYGNVNYSIPELLNDNIQRLDYGTDTTPANINAGQVLLDSFSSPTKIYISNFNNSGENISDHIAALFLSLESIKGVIKINKKRLGSEDVAIESFMVLQALSQPTKYEKYTVISISKNSASVGFSIINGEEIILTMMDNPKRFDLCINILPGDAGYLDLYTFRDPRKSGEVGTKWYNELALTPGSFPLNIQLPFTSGSAQLVLAGFALPDSVIPYIDSISSAMISVQHNIISTSPISSSINIDATTGLVIDKVNNKFTLKVDLKAKKYSGSSWSDLSGNYTIHFIIAIAIPKA